MTTRPRMNLKNHPCGGPKSRCFSDSAAASIATATPRRRRHHRLLHYRRRRSRSDCPKHPELNGRHRTNEKGSGRRCRHNRRRPLRSHCQRILDGHGGSAIGSSAGSKSATSRRPQLRMPPLRSSSFFSRLKTALCGAAIPWDNPYWSRNVAGPFIDHSSEMWNFRRWNASSAVLAP